MKNFSLIVVILFMACPAFAARHKRISRTHYLSQAQMVAKGWRPTPRISDVMQEGAYQGVETVAAIPQLVGSN